MATALSMTRGDSATFQVSISGLTSSGLTGCTLYFTAKRDISDTDANAQFQKSTTGGGITVTQAGNATTPGIANVALVPADTSSLAAYVVVLQWDCALVDASGNHTTVAQGTLTVTPDVTTTA